MSNWDLAGDTNRFSVQLAALDDDAFPDPRGSEGPDLDLVFLVHTRLIAEIDPQKLYSLQPAQAYTAVVTAARRTIAEVAPQVLGEARDALLDAVADEVLGLGPIEKLVKDNTISEIMVNGAELVYFEHEGVIYKSTIR